MPSISQTRIAFVWRLSVERVCATSYANDGMNWMYSRIHSRKLARYDCRYKYTLLRAGRRDFEHIPIFRLSTLDFYDERLARDDARTAFMNPLPGRFAAVPVSNSEVRCD